MSIVEKLRAAGFRLGGSRRMAEKFPFIALWLSPSADWDFYCEDTPERRAQLESMGFDKLDAEFRDYWDNLLVDMYFHEDGNIQVLVRSDVDLYSRSFESITARDYVTSLWKSSPIRREDLDGNSFSALVCDYFNRLFNQVRQPQTLDDIFA